MKEQAGFHSGYGMNDHLEPIKTPIEKTIEYIRPLILTFVNFKKAFDIIELKIIGTTLEVYSNGLEK